MILTFRPGDNLGELVLNRTVNGFVITWLLHLLYRRPFWRKLNWPSKTRWAVVMVLLSAMGSSIIWILMSPANLLPEVDLVALFWSSTATRGANLVIWHAMYFGIEAVLRTNAVKFEASQASLAARVGELKQLQAQLNPHFLFNSLNIIKASTGNPKQTAEAIQNLADYLRFALKDSRPLEPLGRELESLELYLELQRIRFQDDLECSIEATPEALKVMVPPLLVQPLLENAFKYGPLSSPMPLRVAINAYTEADQLIVRVTNSGNWVAPRVTDDSGGTGLTNLRRRLTLLLGDRATVSINHSNQEVAITLNLPRQPDDTDLLAAAQSQSVR